MAGKGITLSQECKIINALGPVDVGGAAKTTDYWSMEDYAHATIIVTTRVVTNDVLLKIYESDNLSGSTKSFIDFKYAQELTAAGDTLAALAWVGAATGLQTGTNNTTTTVIEIDASQLTDGYPCMALLTDNAGNALIAVTVILSGARYQKDPMATAIA